MTTYILPYGPSNGARALAQALGARRLRRTGTYTPRVNDTVINWGNSAGRRFARILNSYESVAIASDKLRTFRRFREAGNVPHPEWTTDRRVAEQWFREGDGRNKVVCRSLLRASEGRGIVVATNAGELVHAPLYVRYFPKQYEYRVHVLRGEIIDVAQKRLRNGEREREGRNQYIRSHANGWIFAHENVQLPAAARQSAIAAVQSLGLDFGAVDLAVNSRGDIRVFEVNTAPGIEGQTVARYSTAFSNLLNRRQQLGL
jgi:glutathione synthase/RimK-type ligase-like ATP-grasp enzyme